ncbi:hypothetical protein [Streptomyces sp. MH60]|uniref:hypothetical protein n=1 Tax=Streptomyces sp. MH60 TaxID=1940758 RepID=UPI000CED949E|nr:hypothetical protein [Streptomyces sp. MH60]PPS89528.1 hypothetical protein BZZ08_01674 [Streptomyces sp. MH60]
MSKRTRLAKAPYRSNGSLMDWVGTVEPHEWRDNKPFPAMLILQGTERGMSAARFVWHSDKGHVYKMFMTDMVSLVQNATNLYKGTADTWWVVQKRGKNYGIRLADNDDLKHAGHVAGPKADCPACEGVAYGYESWCPLPPTADQPHQARHNMAIVGRCICGERFGHPIHRSCTCAPEDRTACSADNCPG